jgi:hypothetical protein
MQTAFHWVSFPEVVPEKTLRRKKGFDNYFLRYTLQKIQTPGEPMSRPRVDLPNIHPADELSAVREEIAILEKRSDQLRELLLAEGADLKGESYTAYIQPNKRETLDKKAITEAFGEEAIAPFVRTTNYNTVKLKENK